MGEKKASIIFACAIFCSSAIAEELSAESGDPNVFFWEIGDVVTYLLFLFGLLGLRILLEWRTQKKLGKSRFRFEENFNASLGKTAIKERKDWRRSLSVVCMKVAKFIGIVGCFLVVYFSFNVSWHEGLGLPKLFLLLPLINIYGAITGNLLCRIVGRWVSLLYFVAFFICFSDPPLRNGENVVIVLGVLLFIGLGAFNRTVPFFVRKDKYRGGADVVPLGFRSFDNISRTNTRTSRVMSPFRRKNMEGDRAIGFASLLIGGLLLVWVLFVDVLNLLEVMWGLSQPLLKFGDILSGGMISSAAVTYLVYAIAKALAGWWLVSFGLRKLRN